MCLENRLLDASLRRNELRNLERQFNLLSANKALIRWLLFAEEWNAKAQVFVQLRIARTSIISSWLASRFSRSLGWLRYRKVLGLLGQHLHFMLEALGVCLSSTCSENEIVCKLSLPSYRLPPGMFSHLLHEWSQENFKQTQEMQLLWER